MGFDDEVNFSESFDPVSARSSSHLVSMNVLFLDADCCCVAGVVSLPA